MTLSWSMDKVGPICRNATDCAIFYDYIRGHDKIDRSVQDASFNYPEAVKLQDLKVELSLDEEWEELVGRFWKG